MARYINVSEIKFTGFTFEDTDKNVYVYLSDVRQAIEQTPTADVEEVKHGEWLDNFKIFNAIGSGSAERCYLVGYKCSLCGRSEIKKEPYCNCGAKMDGNTDD